ncbi:MAG: alanine racemase [Phycisphaera sp.]|nr:alanine racemase [Phycisphaera sp.]
MTPTSRIEVNLSAIDDNYAEWQRVLGSGVDICAVLKADAYGLGAVPIARRLSSIGVKLLAVYCIEQATEIAKTGLPISLMILMPVDSVSRTDILYRSVVAGRLHLTVHSREHVENVESIGRQFGSPIPVHVEVDTGMTRMGASPDDVPDILADIASRRYIKLAGIYTHPSSADHDSEFTDAQLAKFDDVLARNAALIPPTTKVHFAGTHAALRDRRYHKSMARIGLGLYGYGAEALAGPCEDFDRPKLTPAVRWTSHIIHTRAVPAGTPIGYSGLYTTDRVTRLGIVPVGYADGYPLAASNRGVIRVGRDLIPCPIRGQVNMDQIIVDLTQAPDAQVNTDVELIANDPAAPNALPKVAEMAHTNCYELLCCMSSRVQHRYVVRTEVGGRMGHVATV